VVQAGLQGALRLVTHGLEVNPAGVGDSDFAGRAFSITLRDDITLFHFSLFHFSLLGFAQQPPPCTKSPGSAQKVKISYLSERCDSY
jgi:hypothetical protein